MKERNTRHKTIAISMNEVTTQRLNDAANRSGRKLKHEAMIRLAHSLKHTQDIKESYWEILLPKDN
ncbi:TraY domain-containing protein [Citrobacter freundii]|uniref:TraY domain-containing protein n=1 Tax=Citrobacter freundii TaxID=546 RepID=UPI00383AB167